MAEEHAVGLERLQPFERGSTAWFHPSSPRTAEAKLLTSQEARQQTIVRVPLLSSMSTD